MARYEPRGDIGIIGAGPAGLAAGMKLAAKGIPFTLIDKDTFPRTKICGDGLSGKSLMMLRAIDDRLLRSLHQSGLAHPSHGVKFVSPNLKSVSLEFNNDTHEIPAGYVIRRRELDHFLLQELKKCGPATILENTPVKEVRKTDNGFRVLNEERGLDLECGMLLVATGYEPGFIKKIDPGYSTAAPDGLGIRAYYEEVTGFGENHAIEIHFLKEVLPCYLWIFPLGNGRANVGLAMLSEMARKKKTVLKDLLLQIIDQYPHLKKRFRHARMSGRVEAHRLPFYHGNIPVSGDNFMLLGDAARLVDPFTGEGISNALLSGVLAAEMTAKAIEDKDFSADTLKDYDKQLYSRLDKELSLGMRLQDLSRNAMLLNLVIGRASRSKKIKEALSEILFGMNSMGELEKPLFYFKLLLGIG
jgi:geranylgeranyl reductase family protein